MEDNNQNNLPSVRDARLKEKALKKLEEYKNRKKAKQYQEDMEKKRIAEFLEEKKRIAMNQIEEIDSSLSNLKIQSNEKKNPLGLKSISSNFTTPDHFLSDFLQDEDINNSNPRSEVFYFPTTTKTKSSNSKKSKIVKNDDNLDFSNHDEDFDNSDNNGILLQNMSDSIKNLVRDTEIDEEDNKITIFEKLNDFGNYLMNLSNNNEENEEKQQPQTPVQKEDAEFLQISPLLIENYKRILRSNSEVKERNTILKEKIESLELKIKEKENILRENKIEQLQKNSHFESELKLKEDMINQLKKIISFKDEQIEDLNRKISNFDHRIAERSKKEQDLLKEIDVLHQKINELKEKNQEIPKFALEKKISESKVADQVKETQAEKEKNENLLKTIKDLESKLVSKDEELANDKDVIRNLIYEINKQKSKNYETNMKIFLQKIKDEEEIQEFFQGKEQELKKKLEKEITKKLEIETKKREEDLKIRYEIQIVKKEEELKEWQEKCQELSLLAHSPPFANMNSSISPNSKFKK